MNKFVALLVWIVMFAFIGLFLDGSGLSDKFPILALITYIIPTLIVYLMFRANKEKE